MDRHDTFMHMRVRAVVVALALALLGGLVSLYAPSPLLSPALAATWTVDTTARTETDVRAAWNALKPAYVGTPYAAAPSVVAPYAPGDAAAGFRTDGINMINFARYLAGLPSDVTLDAVRNSDAQYGAVLLAASNFSHTPDQPPGMPLDFYTRAKDQSTSKSNIGWGYPDSGSFQKGCLDDSDSSNIVRVGHRRWLLNPQMKVSGIGAATSTGNSMRHTTYSIDYSRPIADVDYSVVAWPSAGIFPVEFVSAATPWSITLNPARYVWDATRAGHVVTLRRVSDGRTWTFDDADSNPAGEYFNAEFSYIGSRNAFIFRPNPADIGAGYTAGDQFDVTLSGGIRDKSTGAPVTVTYRTSFGALTGAATAFSAPLTFGSTPVTPPVVPPVTPPVIPPVTPPVVPPVTPPVIPPVTPPVTPPTTPAPSLMPVYRFYNKVNGSHFYTASDVERDIVIAKWSATYDFENAVYTINTANPANNLPLYRFYNKVNGSHFYTASDVERDTVIAKWPAVFAYEGPVYYVSGTAAGSRPMYRFYNTRNGSHFYTVSPEERDRVIAAYSATYTFEGVCYYIGN